MHQHRIFNTRSGIAEIRICPKHNEKPKQCAQLTESYRNLLNFYQTKLIRRDKSAIEKEVT